MSGPGLTVGAVDDDFAPQWDEYVAGAPDAATYHGYGWRHVIREAFGRETHYLAAREGGRVCGVLPLARLRSRLFGDFLVSLPYFNYGGVIAESHDIELELLETACELGRKLGVSHIEFRHRSQRFADRPARTDKVTMILDLPASSDALWQSLGTKVRAQVKRPQRAGATSESGGAELVADFYAVFAENMRDLGTPVYGRNFFTTMFARFPADFRVFVVRLEGRPVAAAVVVCHRGTLEIPWASSLRSANPLGVNMLLYWSILEYAFGRRLGTVDFGRCTRDSGPYRYKQQWGARPVPLYWHYWLRDGGELPRLNHSNPKYEAAIQAWRRLPLSVANRLGPLLVRNLP